MSLIAELNERKKKRGETSDKSSSGGLMAELALRKKYQSLPVGDVNEEYINTFISDSNRFFGGINDGSVSYSGAMSTIGDLGTRLDTIQGWVYQNKDRLDEKTYSELSRTFEELQSSIGGVKQYYSQWDSEDSYNAWKTREDFISAYLADPEKATSTSEFEESWIKEAQSRAEKAKIMGAEDFQDYSKYTSTKQDGLFKSDYADTTYEIVNRNKDAWDQVTIGKAWGNYSDRQFSDLQSYEYMTDDEVAVYNYHYAKGGWREGQAYLDSIKSILEERKNNQTLVDTQKFADAHPWAASGMSVVTSLGSGFEYLDDMIYYGMDKMEGKDVGIDTNLSAQQTNIIRGTVSEKVDWEINNWDAFDFVYNTAMSGADSMASNLAFGKMGGTVLGLSAAAQATNDALDRGMSDSQAFWNGLIAGVFEGLFETISIGQFNTLKEVAPDSVKDIIKNLGKSMLVNASEETLTELANIAYDTLINGEFANYTMEELANGAWKQALAQVIEAGASGALMGVGMGTVGQTAGYAKGSHAAKQAFGSDPGVLVGAAMEVDPNNSFYQKMQANVDAGKKISGGQLLKMHNQVVDSDVATMQAAAAQRLQELGVTENVDAIASALAKQAAGQELSRSEKRLVKEYDVVAGELTGKYKADWTGKIGTHIINAEEYGRLLKAAETAQEGAKAQGAQVVDQPQKTAQAQQVESVEAPKPTVAENATVDKESLTTADKMEAVTEESSEAPVSIEDASKKYGAQAQAMMHTYQAGQDVAKFDKAYQAAYDMGRSGVALSYVQQSEMTSYLTDQQKKLAHEAGKAAADAKASAKDAANKAAANGKSGRKRGGVVRGEGVTIADLRKAVGDTRGKAYKVLSTIAKVTGVNIVLYKSQTDAEGNFIGEQGEFDPDNPNEIRIDIYAGLANISDVDKLEKYVLLRTFAHEFTHFIEKWNPIHYNELRKVVFDTLTERGKDVDSLIHRTMDEQGLGYEAASREVVAQAMTDMLQDSNFVQLLAQKHKIIFNKLLEKLKEFAQNIRDYFATVQINDAAEANALKEQGKYLDSIVELWDEAAVQAVENYQKTVAIEETAQEVNSNEGREETREAFYRRAHEKVYAVRERGEIACAYNPAVDKTERAGRTEENLKKLGIQVIVHEGLEVNVGGITRLIKGDSTSVGGDAVYVRNSMKTDPMETAGHEAYHFWKHTDARLAYEEIVTDNIDFASDAFIQFQQKIEKAYFDEEIGIEDDGSDKLVEEIYAYITGLVHAGDSNNIVRPFLRDFDAVKAAWEELVKKQTATETDEWADIDGKAIRKELDRRAKEGSPFVEKVMEEVEAKAAAEKPAEPEQSDFEKAFWNASQAERDEVVDAIQKNTKITHMAPTEIRESADVGENEEVTTNGKESENGSDAGAVHEPVRRSEGSARLLEGVEPEAVRGSDEGRQPVQPGGDQGTGDAGRDRRADPEGTAVLRSTRDRVGGDLQQLPGVSEGETDTNVGGKLHEEVAQQIAQKSTENPKGSNYVIGDSLNLPTGTKARVRANIDAIRLVKQIAAEGRIATAAEQEILSKYVGWGGLADAFGKPVSNRLTRKIEYEAVQGLEAEFEELKGVLTEEEYKSARESTKNAHYTSIEVIKAMYEGLKGLGFTGGRMLEPSSGVGNFVGAMPADMTSTVKSWTMVELDSITGLFAKYLYPNADVRIQGFEQTNIPDGYMDVAIGNVPFGKYGVTDKRYPKTITGSIHNYFFAKALDKVRTGGIVMFITSHYTMDGRDSAVRKYMMQRADLLGAIRLPNTAFAGNAGTEVVTDILILKKRADRTEYAGEDFENVTWQSYSGGGASVNAYFANHPEMVLGNVALARGMYGSNEMTVNPFTDKGTLGEQIRNAMQSIQGKMDYPAQLSPEKTNYAVERAKKKQQKLIVKDGQIHTRDESGNLVKVEADKDTAARIAGMVAIRDAHTALCDALQQGVKKTEITKLRKALNKAYDSFVEKYGYLNAPKNKKAINTFTDRYAIQSLENYSTEGKKITVTKSDIFSKDTIAANRTEVSAENVEEGLTISLNTVGRVDVAMIAKLTGQKAESVTRQMIDQRLVFKDKEGNLIPAAQYLSGNVRAKLREMEGLVGIDPDYRNNVEALREVVPPTVQHTDIYVNPGANWVPASVYEDFVSYILKRSNHTAWHTGKKDFSVEYVPETNEYKVTINDGYAKMSAQNTQVWGEGGKPFSTIFENMLNGRRTNVYKDAGDGTRVLDKAKTEAVAEKVEKLNEEFRKWLWADEARRAEMQELYNETYNAQVAPKYSGESLTVNGLNSEYSLRAHQKSAVARIVNSGGNTLLAHRVGAGKTLEMAAAAMKLKQLGVIKKPMFVVPNNVVAQWGKEFKDYFPAANILLVGDEDMTPAERMTTINRIKNNDYDAVILAYTKFEKIQMTAAWRQKFYEEQIDSIVFAINAEKESQGGKGFTVKQLETKRKQLEAKLKKLTDKAKDEDGAMFEDLGVDSLFVDEAHNFKNLEYSTRMNNVSGLGKADGSQRAFDLYTKVRYLQQLNGGRGVVFATATPVMNSMTEMYIMQKYLQPDTLKQLGIEHFDSWAKMFGEVVNALEIAPSGSGYRLKQTFSKFKNVKALQQLFRSFTDVLTEVPGLKIPKMKGRKVQIVECEQGEFQKNYMAELAKRAENVKNVDPSEDNMLKITSDGRKISYSQRMIDPSLPYEETGKIYKCCENVYAVYQESNKTKGTQMIFCDMATPKGKASAKAEADTDSDEFGAMDMESAQLYDDMKARLIELGIPAKEIAFIHDAKNDKQKAALSEKMNDGTIRVLIGSTGKMGVGLNAQKKAVAIHHLDAPWRPGDIEQRDGRVFRQKNENEEAYKFVYVTRGSFDSRLWDILERKQKFINQVMNGEDVGNEIEDTGEVTLSAAEVKAVASDNPLIMEQVALEKEISKLQSLQQAYLANVSRAQENIVKDRRSITSLEDRISNAQADMKNRKDTYSSDKVFSIRVGGQTYTDKKDAGLALVAEATAKATEDGYTDIGNFAGFALRVVKTKEGVKGLIAGAGNYEFKTYPGNPTFGISHLISVVESLEDKIAMWDKRLAETKSDLQTQSEIAAAPFEQAQKLKEKRARYNEVMDILNPPKEEQSLDSDGGDTVQHQQRTHTLSNREVLEMAADELQSADLNEAEKDALNIFTGRLNRLRALQEERKEQGELYKKQQFTSPVDRVAAEQTRNRMQVLDEQIEKAEADVLSVENKQVLQKVLQKARKVVEKQQWTKDQETLKRYRERRNDAAAVKKYRDRLTKDVNDLTNWVLHPNNKDVVKHIPDVLKTGVIPFLSSIDFTSKQQLRGGDATKADKEFMKRLNGLKAALKPNQSINGLYGDYSDLPPNFMERLQTLIDSAQAIVDNSSGEFVVNQMTSDELRQLSQLVRTLKTFIQQFNRFHANAMFQHVSEAGDNTIGDLSQMGNASERTGKVSNFVFWQQIRPAYAWERFGAGGRAIYDGLRRGQAKLAFNTKEIQAFAEKAYTEAEVKAWEKEIKTITLGGDTVKMPVSTIMSFYELSKRPQALGHILGQGVRVATYTANGKKISDVGHMVEQGDVSTIIGMLTDRQKEVADKLQKFMQEQGGQWGNYVSVKRFGEELFGEEHYFPINSDGRYLTADAAENPKQASLYALLNMGFTKATTEGATNRVVLYSIFDVFANHMASMAQYNAFALPVVDAIKWFNYQQKSEPDEDGHRIVMASVRDQMDRVYGVPEETRPGSGRQGYAQSFVINILRAFNGTEAQGPSYDDLGMKMMHNYNRAQIAYNFRVVVQQPLAITRAALLVDYGSIIKGMKLSPAAIRKNIQEMQQYSGIAAWKGLGFYDVNISRGLTDTIKHANKPVDKVIDFGMKGAEKADLMTWAGIWSACKEEVIKKQHLTPNSEGFFDAVTLLFEDVIYKTQVVDSVLTKNEYMRSKGFWARTMSAFMSEPTTTASMLIDAYDKLHADMQRGLSKPQAWKKNGKMIVRTAYVYGVSAVLLAAVQAVADAFRDDDDYQEWYEKWLEAFGGNLVDEIMPVNKLPLLSQFYEFTKELIAVGGFDIYGQMSNLPYVEIAEKFIKGAEILWDKFKGEDTNYTWYGGAYKLLQAVSGMTGLPMAAATREIVTLWNDTVGAMAPSLKVKTYDPGDKNEIKYAYQDGYLTAEEAAQQLLEQGLVDNEDEAYWTVQGWEAGDGYSRYDAVYDAVRNGADITEAMAELTAHGYDEDDVLSQVKEQIGKWYTSGEITKQQAIQMLTKYTDMDSEDITATVNKWSSKVVTGIAYEDIKDEYMDGNITASRAKEMYMRYGGYTEEEAAQKVAVLAFVKEHPALEDISYSAVEKYQTYCEGTGVSAETFYDVWKYHSDTKADVDENGDSISGSKKAKVLDYINTLDLSYTQKDSLYYAFGWAKSTIDEAPWH